MTTTSLKQRCRGTLRTQNLFGRTKATDDQRTDLIQHFLCNYRTFDQLAQRFPTMFKREGKKYEIFKDYFLVLKFLQENPEFPEDLKSFLINERKSTARSSSQHELQSTKRIFLQGNLDAAIIDTVRRTIFSNFSTLMQHYFPTNPDYRNTLQRNVTTLQQLLSNINLILDQLDNQSEQYKKLSTVYPGLRHILENVDFTNKTDEQLVVYFFMFLYAYSIRPDLPSSGVTAQDLVYTGDDRKHVLPDSGEAQLRTLHTVSHRQQVKSFIEAEPCNVIFNHELFFQFLIGSHNALEKVFIHP